MTGSLPLHGKSLLFGLIMLGALGSWVSRKIPSAPERIFDVAIEHQDPVSLTFSFTTKKNAGLLELTVGSGTGVLVSLPFEWERTQVKNTTIGSVIAEDAALGFRRWLLPNDATITYKFSGEVDGVRVFNPSKRPVEIKYTHVDLDAGNTKTDSKLFTAAEITIP